jgi:hypothetical protein
LGIDVLKQYLVSLGFSVNNEQFNKMNQTLTDMSKTVQTHTEGMTKAFVVASTSIVSALGGVAVATAGLVDQVANADLAYQKFALRMYTTADVAKQLKIVTGAMGENINDIAWVPELTQRYTALMQQAKQMETPGDAENGLKKVRDIRFEFTRMKIEAMYGMQWIAYYLIKYLGGPLDAVENKLKAVNDWITKNIPIWTQKIAQWVMAFIDFGKSIVRFANTVIDAFKRLWNSMGGGEKAFTGFGSLITAFFLSGPLGKAMMLMGTFLLLLDDFYAYIDGRKSSKTMAPLWKHLTDIKGAMPDFGDGLDDLKKKVESLAISVGKLANDSLKSLKDQLTTIFSIIWDSLKKNGVWQSFTNALDHITNGINAMIRALSQSMVQLGILSADQKYRDFWTWFSDELSRELKQLFAVGKLIGDILKMQAQLSVGDFKGALETIKGISIIQDIKDANAGGNLHGTSRSWDGSAGNKEMMGLANQVSSQTGIPADLIYGQWGHESGNFSSDLAKENNNFGGLKNSSGDYMNFDSPQDFASYFAKYIKLYAEDGILQANTPEEYAAALKHGRYFEDSVSNYANGVSNFSSQYDSANNLTPSGYSPYGSVGDYAYNSNNTSAGSTNSAVYNITVNATSGNPQGIGSSVIDAIKTARMTQAFSGT